LPKSNNELHWKEASMLRRELLRQGATGALFAVSRLGPSDTSQPEGANAIATATFDVRSFGATGNRKTLDSPSINRAIDAAAAAGGGTIIFPAGVYASYTTRLKSHISLYLSAGATILAADAPQKAPQAAGTTPPVHPSRGRHIKTLAITTGPTALFMERVWKGSRFSGRD
jgi:hypothetical protein